MNGLVTDSALRILATSVRLGEASGASLLLRDGEAWVRVECRRRSIDSPIHVPRRESMARARRDQAMVLRALQRGAVIRDPSKGPPRRICAPAVRDGQEVGLVVWAEGGLPAVAINVATEMAGVAAAVIADAMTTRQVHEQARRDPLTGVFSRRRMDELIERYRSDRRVNVAPMAIIMVDLDKLKVINDTAGHKAGDTALATMGAAICSSIREGDMPCRYGGDEFCILLPDADEEQAYMVTERLRKSLGDTPVAGIGPVRFSAGVAIAQGPAMLDVALAGADNALNLAKRAGRNQVFFGMLESGPIERVTAPRMHGINGGLR